MSDNARNGLRTAVHIGNIIDEMTLMGRPFTADDVADTFNDRCRYAGLHTIQNNKDTRYTRICKQLVGAWRQRVLKPSGCTVRSRYHGMKVAVWKPV